jgi:hypothetical protein
MFYLVVFKSLILLFLLQDLQLVKTALALDMMRHAALIEKECCISFL